MTEIKLYTLAEVADILKVTRRTLYNYLNAGQLNAVKIGNLWRVNETEITRLKTQGTAPANKL